MKVSVVVTVLNEESAISELLEGLLSQFKKADEIIIVDGGSTDATLALIKHYQKKDQRIKVLKENVSRAKGRNLGVEVAKNEIIVMTDAGCVPKKNWIKNIIEPFSNPQIEVVAGFYKMVPTISPNSTLQKAMSIFLGVTPRKFDVNFLPSTRSIAFRRSAWEKVGGFPESLTGTAEDTVFNSNLVKNNIKIARVKKSVVEWGMPQSVGEFAQKVFNYAKGDAKSKILFFPGKNITSHNIKALSVFLRYVFGLLFFVYSLSHPPLFPILIVLFIAYGVWAYRKVFIEFEEARIALWGPVLQIVSDVSVISGFLIGLLKK